MVVVPEKASNRREVTGREANRLVAEPATSRRVWLLCTNFVPPIRERWRFRIFLHCIFCNLQNSKARGKNDPVSGHHIFNNLQIRQSAFPFQFIPIGTEGIRPE